MSISPITPVTIQISFKVNIHPNTEHPIQIPTMIKSSPNVFLSKLFFVFIISCPIYSLYQLFPYKTYFFYQNIG